MSTPPGPRRLIIPLLVTLPLMLVLVGLGTWQAQRLGWKSAILARIDAAEAGPPAPLPAAPVVFTKVEAAGRFDHAREALVGLEVRGAVLGSRLVTPLLRPDAPAILVDRGWVPLDGRAGVDQPAGDLLVTGWVRPVERAGMFSATDDAPGRRFYTFDPEVIGPAVGLPAVAPFGLVAMGEGGGLPQPDRRMPRPSNNHLGYAITWYGLAVALAGVFLVWARRRLKD
jgi:surfeit locus 1 family protein